MWRCSAPIDRLPVFQARSNDQTLNKGVAQAPELWKIREMGLVSCFDEVLFTLRRAFAKALVDGDDDSS